MRLSFLPFFLLIVPIMEITTFVIVGDKIGVFWTIACILFTAILGAILLRIEGLRTFATINAKMQAGELPGRELGNGAMILVAGVLLLTPGFLTDTLGFSLFIPFVRDAIWHFFASRVRVQGFGPGAGGPINGGPEDLRGNSNVAEGEVIDLDEEDFGEVDGKSRPDPESPWNKNNG